MSFLNPARLWLLLVVAVLAGLYVAVLLWRSAATVRFTQVELIDRVAPRRPAWRRHVIALIQLVGLAAAVVASARPVERSIERTNSEGRILVLFDVSLSMQATDVEPDRFEAARAAARDFVEAVDADVEIGLVSFSGAVGVDVAPTLDRAALDRGLDRLELAESTAIGDALSVAARLLVDAADPDDPDDPNAPAAPDDPAGEASTDDRAAGETDRAPGVIVLLSDGETTVGRLTSAGAQEAADAGIPVFTIAFGTDAGMITDPVSGERIPVPVRPADLQLVADTTGGAAFEARTGTELSDAYDQIRESLGTTLGEEIEVIDELTWQWALAAFALLSTAWALSLWWLRGLV